MEWANKAANFVSRAANNNAVLNVALVGCFAALSIRSVSQQREIELLESESESLLKANKTMKKTMWDWKQQLFDEAGSAATPLVPLSRLKAIYGEATAVPSAGDDGANADANSPATKIVI